MTTYETFARDLDRLLGSDQAVRINVSAYMPLSIEAIGRSAEGGTLVALSHTAVQNGDLMRDPEIVFEIRTASSTRAAEPLSFRNDFTGTYQEVYRYSPQGRRTHLVPSLKNELRSFVRMWFRNLHAQGFFGTDAVREPLA
jgi:hypothetical protein